MDVNVLIVFSSVTIIVFAALYLNFRARQSITDTVRGIVDKAGGLDQQTAAAMAAQLTSTGSDLRRGVLSIAVALAIVIASQVVSQEQVIRPLLAVAAFPAMIGAGYLLLHVLRSAGKASSGADTPSLPKV